ncbi:MAG: shikimate kinase [Hyphomicrobiaceae bacterium]|nr:shikimate kinase [Hyphomicrobiaceae bacterium]
MIRLGFGRRNTSYGPADIENIVKGLQNRSLVMVGLMGCGKSAVGKRLAAKLSIPFVDADEEIERVAGMTITDIFAKYGEPHFRDREAKVIARLLTQGSQVLATGGGAFMSPDTRAAVRQNGLSIWLKAELPVLMRRVSKRSTRPLLRTDDPEAVMRRLMAERYPVYAEADITIESRDVAHDVIVDEIIAALLASGRLAPPAMV